MALGIKFQTMGPLYLTLFPPFVASGTQFNVFVA